MTAFLLEPAFGRLALQEQLDEGVQLVWQRDYSRV
jgi:hypothetical protein